MTLIRNHQDDRSPSTSLVSSIPTSNLTSLPHRPSTSATSTSTTPSSEPSPSTTSTAATYFSQQQSQPTLQAPAPLTTPLNLPTSSSPQRIPRQVLTRRRCWLEKHPSYFSSASADAELSNPLEYDRLIRRHQSASEREEEGKKKGWAGTLEAGLLRGEARRDDVRGNSNQGEAGEQSTGAVDWSIAESLEVENEGEDKQIDSRGGLVTTKEEAEEEEEEWDDFTNDLAYLKSKMAESQSLRPAQRSPSGPAPPSAFARSDTAKAQAKKQGEGRWRALLAERFVSGKDENFDYSPVDRDEELDGDWVGRRKEEEWFEEEESEIEGPAKGETGVQDF